MSFQVSFTIYTYVIPDFQSVFTIGSANMELL